MTATTTRPARRVRGSLGWYVVFALVAGALAGGLSLAFNMDSRSTLGIPDPGVITTVGFPLAKAGGEMLAALAIGSFMLAAFASKPRPDGTLDLDGWAAARTGRWAIFSWGAIAFLQIPLVLSDVSGQPLSTTIRPENWSCGPPQYCSRNIRSRASAPSQSSSGYIGPRMSSSGTRR